MSLTLFKLNTHSLFITLAPGKSWPLSPPRNSLCRSQMHTSYTSSLLGILGSCTGTGRRKSTCMWLKCRVVSAHSRICAAPGTRTKPRLLVNDLNWLQQRLISSAWWLGPSGSRLCILLNINLYSHVSALYRLLFMSWRNKSESLYV